jgi:ElaB/YqjD/DUF883 family membrane-anchored ribosome-binding protein
MVNQTYTNNVKSTKFSQEHNMPNTDAQELKSSAKEIKKDYNELKEKGREAGNEIKDTISDTASDMKENAKHMFNQAGEEIKKQSVQARDVVTEYIQEKPFTALGIAALVGMGVALLLRKS